MIVIENGDKIQGDASAATVVDYTLHGVVTTTLTQLADGQLAATAAADVYAATATVVVTSIILVNTDTAARTTNLYLLPSGGTARRLIPKNLSLGIGYSLYFDGGSLKILDAAGKLLTSAQPDSITSFLEDTPSNAETTKAPTSNWAYDHGVASTGVHGAGTATIATTADVTTHAGLTATHGAGTILSVAAGTILITTHAGSTDAHIGGAGTVLSVATGTALITTHASSTDAHIGGAGTVLSMAAGTVLINTHSALTTGVHSLGTMALAASANYLLKQMVEDDPLLLDAAISGDGHYSGVCEAGVSGTALAFGDVAYFVAASSRWNLAVASSATTAKGKLGMCVSAATAAVTTTILLYGKINAAAKFPALPIGDPIYLSAGTAGVVTGTAVAGTTDYVVRIVGYGNTADELFFCPDSTYLELA